MGIPLDKALGYFLMKDFIGGFRLGMKYFMKPKATVGLVAEAFAEAGAERDERRTAEVSA